MKSRIPQERGFSLLELLVTLGLVAIAFTVLYTSVDDALEEEPPFAVHCEWWEHDVCLCEVGDRSEKWGFIAPPIVAPKACNPAKGTKKGEAE